MGRSSRFLVFLSLVAIAPALDATGAWAFGRLATNRFFTGKHVPHHRHVERRAGSVSFDVGPLPENQVPEAAAPAVAEGYGAGFLQPCVHPLIIHVRHRPSPPVKIPRVVYGSPPCAD